MAPRRATVRLCDKDKVREVGSTTPSACVNPLSFLVFLTLCPDVHSMFTHAPMLLPLAEAMYQVTFKFVETDQLPDALIKV